MRIDGKFDEDVKYYSSWDFPLMFNELFVPKDYFKVKDETYLMVQDMLLGMDISSPTTPSYNKLR